MQKIGIIGISGRMGSLLAQAIQKENLYKLGINFNQSSSHDLKEVFLENDLVVDFSSHKLLPYVIAAVTAHPKPLAICTTSWQLEQYRQDLEKIALKAPIVIAPNTSLGANLQLYLTSILAKILDSNYDIDIVEKHHRHKIDIPSGTSNSLLKEIQQTKRASFNCDYESYCLKHGPRPENFISLHVARTGNVAGEHEVTFNSNSESITIKHTAFNRELFADGAIKIIRWFDQMKPEPGIYSMFDIFNLNSFIKNNK